MKRESLVVQEMAIHRAPGFERGGFTISDLSPGINLVYGPNGVGKSTTARAVAQLLWPSLTQGERISLTGRGALAERGWAVDVDGGRADWQVDGVGGSAPRLPSADAHRRYRLALHDLLQERDSDFAAVILRESAGGYDVRAHSESLGARMPSARRHRQQREALERARRAYDAALAAQRDLQERERELAALRGDLAQAGAARQRKVMLEVALEHAKAREAEVAAAADLARFEAGMARVSGDEYTHLCTLRERLQKLEEEHREQERAVEEAQGLLEQLALPREALADGLLPGLEADLERLEKLDQSVVQSRGEQARAASMLQQIADRLGGVGDPARLAAVDARGIEALAELIVSYESLSARRRTLQDQLRSAPAPALEEDPDRLREGVRLLRCWLREPPPPVEAESTTEPVGKAAALLLIVVGVVLAITGSPLYLGVALVGAALLWLLMRRPANSPVGAHDGQAVHRREYERLGLELPAEWQPDAVIALLDRLQAQEDATREAQALRRQRERDEAELAVVEAEHATLEARCAEIAQRLGVVAVQPRALAELVDQINQWQRSRNEVEGVTASLEEAQRQLGALEEELRSRLAAIGYIGLTTVGELKGAVRAFRTRLEDHRVASRALASARDQLQQLEANRAERLAEVDELFRKLELEPDQDDTVRAWCERRAEYRKAHDNHHRARGVRESVLSRLERFEEGSELIDLAAGELEVLIADETAAADRYDEIAHEITATETLITSAKRSHDVESALAAVQRAEDALRDALEEESRAAIAQELIEAIDAATRDQHLPAVFQRARDLFSRVTHGRYELRMSSEGVAEFSAYDTVEGRMRALEQLSSGTRVQLLLAVRVAFVEQQEDGVMLPVVLDEVLGNSDDERARAIMEAVVELAREGRQILYFTAQADEVARWRSLGSAGGLDGVTLREIDLAQVRGEEGRLVIPDEVRPARRLPPEPAGVDHAEYGQQLAVPRIDRAAARAGSLHLWYLMDDPVALFRFLELGVERWGPLQSLLRDGGRTLLDADEREHLEARGRAVEAFLDAARVGVGRPVDRSVLEDSKAVTATFIDRVTAAAKDVQGDAAQLVEALDSGAVARFPQRAKMRLREYLEDHGYLPTEEPLSLSTIHHRVLCRITPDLTEGRMTSRELHALLARLWLGVGGSDGESGGEVDGAAAAEGIGVAAGDLDAGPAVDGNGGGAGDLDDRLSGDAAGVTAGDLEG